MALRRDTYSEKDRHPDLWTGEGWDIFPRVVKYAVSLGYGYASDREGWTFLMGRSVMLTVSREEFLSSPRQAAWSLYAALSNGAPEPPGE